MVKPLGSVIDRTLKKLVKKIASELGKEYCFSPHENNRYSKTGVKIYEITKKGSVTQTEDLNCLWASISPSAKIIKVSSTDPNIMQIARSIIGEEIGGIKITYKNDTWLD